MWRPRLKWAKKDSLTGAELPDFEWRTKGIFAGKKILARANMDPTGQSFLRGFIDTGHYPSNSFDFIWIDPKLAGDAGWNYEALLAIINGPICDAWMGVARTLTNPVDLLRRVPVPRLDQKQIDLLALDEALTGLEQKHPENARIIKLRFFAGLSLEDAAQAMGISRATAQRKWAYARAWLYGQLHD